MSCAGYFFQDLLKQAEQESFKNQVLREINEKKQGLQRKIKSLQVQGDFHKVNQIQVQIDRLDRTENVIKRILET